MNAGIIARRYATVLFDFADDRGELERAYNDSKSICEALATQGETRNLLGSPLIKPSEKKAFITGAFAGHVAQTLVDFILFTVDKGRIGIIGEILRVFQVVYRQRLGIKKTGITTAKELSPDKQRELTELMAEKLHGKVETDFKSDASIIGGVIVSIDSKQLDCSILHQLKEIEKRLTV